jgi:rare lipoprotein A (peptidoglycan hydrolase)
VLIAGVLLGGFAFAAVAFAAAPSSATMLGVDENTAVALGPEVPADAKFAAANPSTAEHRKLLAPAAKRVAKKAAKQAPTHRAAKVSKHVKRTDAHRTTGAKGGWKRARVSWYGPGFYGHGMAGGGKLTKTSMVCAHRSLPFGTKVKFSYKGRTVIAVVKDRGPFIAGRTFDLGPGPAKALKFSGVGTVKYRIVK